MQQNIKARRQFLPCIPALLSLLLAPGLLGQTEQASLSTRENTSTDNPPARVARISYLKGNVSFLRAGLDQWSQAALNFPATTGDRIYTDRGARAELEVGPYAVRLSEATDLTITNLSDQIMQLGLEQGALRVTVHQLPSGNTVEVDTPNGALTLLEDGRYRIETDPSGERTFVSVDSGRMEITGGGVSQTVEAGQAIKLTGHDPTQIDSVPLPPPDAFDEWSDQRDHRLASSDSSKYVSPSIPGYDDLDSSGRWVDVAEYGPIWYPIVPAGWVPYRFGHWVWIDPWGWTWVEDEPWGFCPFHYGRWVYIGAAWGWLPGPVVVAAVYAPALVAFLGGPHFSIGIGVGLVGWFPLGPGEPFFPWYHYSGNYLNVINVTNIRNVTNMTNITNVTNINDVHYAYKTIATTAVPKNVLTNGQPVAQHVVHVPPQQLAKTEITPHPAVNPTKRAVMPGRPVSPPPVHAQHFVAPNTTGRAGARPAPAGNQHPISQPSKKVPPTEPAGRTPPPAPSRGTQPATNERGVRPRMTAPGAAASRFIPRALPPPPPVPFTQRRPAMAEHPGRPLEPPQIEDLRGGRPVGPMQDKEFPPHPVAVHPERPANVPHPAPIHRR